jgi:hypothetical protein
MRPRCGRSRAGSRDRWVDIFEGSPYGENTPGPLWKGSRRGRLEKVIKHSTRLLGFPKLPKPSQLFMPRAASEILQFSADASLAYDLIGFEPQLSHIDTIVETAWQARMQDRLDQGIITKRPSCLT